MGLLHHPNIVRLYEIIEIKGQNTTCLVLEYVEGEPVTVTLLTQVRR